MAPILPCGDARPSGAPLRPGCPDPARQYVLRWGRIKHVIARRAKSDQTLASAVEVAQAALVDEVGAEDVGAHLGFEVEGERVGSHLFDCTRAGYRGWRWSVTVVRAVRQRTATIAEVVL